MNAVFPLVLAVALVVVLAFFLFRARRRIGRLRAALNSASLELQQVQKAFHRFAPRSVVEQIIRQGVAVHGERQEVSIVFVDIVGFTNLAESMEAEQLVEVLNGYFESMSLAISQHRGYVSKFIGDGLMALFGTPHSNRWHALDAVWAALAMRAALKEYNESLRRRDLAPLEIGIGIHCGQVVAGVIGNQQLMEFTVIGDAVNTAARIEAQTRVHQVDILISQAVRRHLDDKFRVRELPPITVKGKREALTLFTVEGYADHEESGVGRGALEA
ncbi:adenylate/guanylate cyclase domain-containing protein [Neolewinella litorea]|uniref:Adenylate/guanylate cyclase domain-containing protein n=1 Tax=Neolewinella litorea TaxID=2562452 RepID=A0A4S4NEK2_9BACT|nr:adenylate/guanylate cyclase domain-containing protein [Neolewinella litorea]THH37972.1 adenylate/guanylate cyclase domain-containing protein [Neolewinella litorea]